MLVSSLSEVISIGAILPVLRVISDPSFLASNDYIKIISQITSISSSIHCSLLIIVLFGISALLASSLRIFSLWSNLRLAAAVGTDMSNKAYLNVLNQPYSYHVKQNTSKILNVLTKQVLRSVNAINSVLNLISSFSISLSVFISLILIDWKISLFSASAFSMTYINIAIYSRRELNKNSRSIAQASNNVIRSIQEGIGAIEILF